MARRQEQFEYDTGNMAEYEEPPMYRVLLLNDDYTPMDFVVEILREIFHKDRPEAERIMLNVHRKGAGLPVPSCGVQG